VVYFDRQRAERSCHYCENIYNINEIDVIVSVLSSFKLLEELLLRILLRIQGGSLVILVIVIDVLDECRKESDTAVVSDHRCSSNPPRSSRFTGSWTIAFCSQATAHDRGV
jgi:hypothetical protein